MRPSNASDAGHGHNPIHGAPASKLDLSFDPNERKGLSTAQAEELQRTGGFNELPVIEVSKLWIFFIQFTGTMPYMLWLACIISAACDDWPDLGIILTMLICNGCLGFREELECIHSLEELTKKMESKIATMRDGAGVQINTRELVPGDVVLLVGGNQVPADIEWMEGDILSVDTAALTGEGLPRKYPSEQYGKLILCGSIIAGGEAYGIVRKTGTNTEIGGQNVEIMKDKTKKKVSLFEQRVLMVVQVIISVSLLDVLIIFIVQGLNSEGFTSNGIEPNLLGCLSIIVAAIPIALPIVMNVTMSLGAAKMAREFSAVVTSVPALQDICSMSVLCSDKTGTLTTARITIIAESVWCAPGFQKEDVALYGMLASSRDKTEDAIDRSVVGHFDRVFGPKGDSMVKEYTKTRNVGFSPVYKRVLYEYTHPKMGKVTIAKGLPIKVIDTADGGKDDADDQWEVDNIVSLRPEVKKVDYDFSKRGYKTLGVSLKINNDPWVFCGILPMIDPPRHDTKDTIDKLVNAGIRVKMITGDHLNIAKETARKIGMGTDIYTGEDTRGGTHESHSKIENADGFAQVLPKDKREVVEVLKKNFNYVVGMTGDGVNDAPALSAAQCGVAVHDATDAAKNAAAIILTSEGLSAIYSAVVESRRIFRKLKSYVTYRFAASIQIVAVLTVLIFASKCAINSLYIIILALFNDLTMLPIAYDFQQASKMPEEPNVIRILTTAGILGLCETFFTLLFAYGANRTSIFLSPMDINQCHHSGTAGPPESVSIQAAIWLQMFIASELLIFSARAPTYAIFSLLPSPWLATSVITGCIVASLMANLSSQFGNISGRDVVAIWIYNIICLAVIDYIKVKLFEFFNENMEVLPDYVPPKEEHSSAAASTSVNTDLEQGVVSTSGASNTVNALMEAHEDESLRMRASLARMNDWAINNDPSLSAMDIATARESLRNRQSTISRHSVSHHTVGRLVTSISASFPFEPHSPLVSIFLSLSYTNNQQPLSNNSDASDRVSISRSTTSLSSDLHGSMAPTSGSLRPNTPGNRRL